MLLCSCSPGVYHHDFITLIGSGYMSKLLYRLERINKGSSAPIGFGAASHVDKTPAMALIGRLAQNYKQGANRLAKLGADAALLSGVAPGDELSEITRVLKNIPWGVLIQDMDGDKASELVKQGCDFFVLGSGEITIEAIKDQNPGYILSIPPNPDDKFLRVIEDLPVDAGFMSIGSIEPPITLQHLIALGSVRTMFDKYLIAEVPAEVSSNELEGLRDIGLDALVVDAGRSTERVLKTIRERLLDLPRQRKQRADRMNPVLPRHVSISSHDIDDDIDDDIDE